MRRWARLAAVLFLFAAVPARAGELAIPGVSADAASYQRALHARFPAGGTERQWAEAEANGEAADIRADYAAGANAWAERAGQADAGTNVWLALARDLLRRPHPDAARALEAAWIAWGMAQDSETPEQTRLGTDALGLMRQALAALNRPIAELDVLEYAAGRSPDDADLRTAVAKRRQEIGLVLRGISTEPESFPARACLRFVGTPGGQADFHPGDWVRLAPAVPDAAVTLDQGAICIAGLRPGTTTHVVLRAGMPGQGGSSLRADVASDVAMAHRQPRVVLDGQRFLQARSAAAEIGLASVNMPAVKLTLVRIGERAAQPFLAEHQPGDGLGGVYLDNLLQAGAKVWSGTAAVPGNIPDELVRTRLPLPGAMLEQPGLYAVLAAAADDSTRSDAPITAAQLVLRTDLAPTAWQGVDGMLVQVIGYAAARAKPGVEVSLIAADNDVLATATTGDTGMTRFDAPLLRGQNGSAPAALHLRGSDGDMTVLSLTRAAFDLSDRGVSGRAIVAGIDAFVWTDRGIYRPGELVHAMALPRDSSGQPITTPLRAIVLRPNGQVFSDTVPSPGTDGALEIPVQLSGGAQIGTWKVVLRPARDGDTVGEAVGEASFAVDAFVPARIAVELTPPAAPLPPGRTTRVPVAVRFLYGAPGAGLTGTARVAIEADPVPFAALRDYSFGLTDERVETGAVPSDLDVTDAAGATSVAVDLSRLPDVTGALRAVVTAMLNDPAGRPVGESVTLPIRPAGPLIGIRAGVPGGVFGGVFGPGAEAAFDVVAVDPDGAPVAMPGAKLTLVRRTPDWRLVVRRGRASYETQWREEAVDSRTVDLAAAAPLHLSYRLGYGEYRLQVVQAGRGLAAASRAFSAGWTVSENADVPARVRVATDRPAYGPGEVAHVHIDAPYAGPATLLVVSDRVHEVRAIDIAPGGTTTDVAIGADWGAGAYVAVHVFRPTDGQPAGHAVSERAIGVAWLGLESATRRLAMTIEPPDVLRPRGPATVTVHAPPGTTLTLAAVDEGVLRLTKYASPDPLGWFTGQRALAVDIRDEWGRLLRPAEGQLSMLREGGGDDMDGTAPPPPQRVVSLWHGPVTAGADGTARITLDLPDFNGQLRLMAVGWAGARIGSASADVLVRDKLVAEALLPRFLAPGDTSRLGVSLQNVELPAGPVHVAIAASGALSLDGPAALDATLAAGQRTTLLTGLRAGDPGEGRIALDLTGPGGFAAHREVSLFVHPARGRTTVVAGGTVPPGGSVAVTPPLNDFVPGTARASLSVGTGVRYNVAALVQALSDYPLSCLEQASSRGLPLAMLPDDTAGSVAAGADRAGRLQGLVGSVLDRQRYDGGFGLWSSEGDAEPWLSAYATEFLLRARRAGAAVPASAIETALRFQSERTGRDASSPEEKAAAAYGLYVLALADQAPAAAIRRMATAGADALPTPLARAQLGAALARIAEPAQGQALIRAALSRPARGDWALDDGSSLRDATASAVLLSESGGTPDRALLAAALPGADLDPASLSTQEQAWAAAAGAALTGRTPAQATLDGTPMTGTATLDHAATLRNTGAAAFERSLVTSGVPKVAPAAARHGMSVRRNFYTMAGDTLTSPDKLAQATDFVMLVEGRAEDGQAHRAMLTAGLPAGWEIAGHLPAGKVPGMDWLGELSGPRAEAARDDRVTAAFDLPADKPDVRYAVLLRATTPGDYEYPGLELSDMYRPSLFARQAAVRVTVLPAP